jgi:hypothetical protein
MVLRSSRSMNAANSWILVYFKYFPEIDSVPYDSGIMTQMLQMISLALVSSIFELLIFSQNTVLLIQNYYLDSVGSSAFHNCTGLHSLLMGKVVLYFPTLKPLWTLGTQVMEWNKLTIGADSVTNVVQTQVLILCWMRLKCLWYEVLVIVRYYDMKNYMGICCMKLYFSYCTNYIVATGR